MWRRGRRLRWVFRWRHDPMGSAVILFGHALHGALYGLSRISMYSAALCWRMLGFSHVQILRQQVAQAMMEHADPSSVESVEVEALIADWKVLEPIYSFCPSIARQEELAFVCVHL